jgi:hypothetical protein
MSPSLYENMAPIRIPGGRGYIREFGVPKVLRVWSTKSLECLEYLEFGVPKVWSALSASPHYVGK